MYVQADVEVFCPHRVKFWEDTCSQVEFGNSTAISLHNELNVIGALRRSIEGLFSSYPSSAEEDRIALQDMGVLGRASPMGAAVLMRLREKELLFRLAFIPFFYLPELYVYDAAPNTNVSLTCVYSALAFLDGQELAAKAGEVPLTPLLRLSVSYTNAFAMTNQPIYRSINYYGQVPFQLEQRARERAAEDAALDEHRRFMETVRLPSPIPNTDI